MSWPDRLLLVSCYELGHQPHALASPLGFLARAGLEADTLDLAVQPFDPERVRRAWFVGISVPMHTALRLGVRAARRVREVSPGAHICFYGLYATLNAEYLLRHGADSVLGGEYEAELVDLVRRLAHERSTPAGAAAPTGRPILGRLTFAVPERAALPPLERYAKLERDGATLLAGYVEASRGCLHQCLHCPIPPVYGGRFFVVQREVVREDIRRQVEAGARHITFGDPDFLNGPRHALTVVRALDRDHPGVSFDITTKIEHILENREIFPELAALGCAFVVSAVESLSDRVLERLEKGHTRADVEEAFDILQAAGIPMRPSLLPFTPWSTFEDYLELLDFVERRGLVDQVDPVHYSIRLLVPPGSALLGRAETRDWLGSLDEASFTYRWTHPDPRMDALQLAVSAIVERAACDGEDTAVTLARVRALARAARDGRAGPAESAAGASPIRKRAPRLTESWFC